jgi:hypothetical protein
LESPLIPHRTILVFAENGIFLKERLMPKSFNIAPSRFCASPDNFGITTYSTPDNSGFCRKGHFSKAKIDA